MHVNLSNSRSWMKKAGWIGFMFFFLKGLVWIALGFTAFNLFE